MAERQYSNEDLIKICNSLGINDVNNINKIIPFGSGHINDTFRIFIDDKSLILQHINTEIFKDPDGMMENISRVTKHIANKGKRSMDVIAYKCPWRVLSFVEGAHTVDVITDPKQAYIAGKAFGAFQNDLADFPSESLHETIPEFHNTVSRLSQLDNAAKEDKLNRLKNVYAEMEFVDNFRPRASKVLDLIDQGKIPLRITHNDTKINNVMLDDNTGEAVAVVDLDTVMPGSALYDFGDMVRTATASAEEDEKDLSKMYSKIEYFDALTKGYLSEAKFLNKYELDNLVFSGILITFTIGIRFLADYLAGDVYFKTDYPDHNLVRAKTQFKMVQSIEDQLNEYEDIVRKYSKDFV